MARVIDNEKAKQIVRMVLNIARLETVGFWINDNGERVHGDIENQKELLQYRLRLHGRELLNSLQETEVDP